MIYVYYRDQEQLNRKLWEAANHGNIEKVSFLLSERAQPNWQDCAGGYTALHCACWKNHPLVTKLLLSKDANANILDIVNNTPLHVACYRGSLPCIPLLVEAGSDTG